MKHAFRVVMESGLDQEDVLHECASSSCAIQFAKKTKEKNPGRVQVRRFKDKTKPDYDVYKEYL